MSRQTPNTLIGNGSAEKSAFKIARSSLALYSMIVGCAFMTAGQYAGAQGTTTLRDPLIPGALSTQAGIAPGSVQLPPLGSGAEPPQEVPGQAGSPTLLPWVPNIPATQIDQPDSQLSLPYNPTAQTAPGVLGYELAPSVPASPSTPGADPGMLTTPQGYPLASIEVGVCPGGGLPVDPAPTTRRGGQTTQNFGLRNTSGSRLYDFGQPLPAMPNLAKAPQYSQDGPRVATYIDQGGGVSRYANLPNAQATTDLYGLRVVNQNDFQPQAILAPY